MKPETLRALLALDTKQICKNAAIQYSVLDREAAATKEAEEARMKLALSELAARDADLAAREADLAVKKAEIATKKAELAAKEVELAAKSLELFHERQSAS